MPPSEVAARASALRTGLMIAAAIGVHNFAEGLAIGVSASAGEIGLATVLIIGFALHNATEGFGIVGPLGDVRPSLALARPGRPDRRRPDVPRRDGRLQRHQRAARAALLRARRRRDPVRDRRDLDTAMRRCGHRELGLLLLSAGFAAGVVTDLVVAYGGG